ncbi:spirocyclase AveC family protein [Mycobacterium sp. E796]|uniref:spirocyclase AveC family protein n=1 Tax=Mycobacterium sp. E796 TaxID=1834151 RepID=UPI0007FCFD63|nr:spirocyclase AveC family protein [Mycobacterium sp. E796]OBI50111.1 hypothetical protein A5706_25645 [Mycobacterium sp. E796]
MSTTASVRVFEVASVISLLCVLAYFVKVSIHRRRIHPILYLASAIVAISWMEAPFDRAMFVQFHPDMLRLPAIGPLAATQGGLPVISPAGYVMYYLLPALAAIALAGRVAHRWALSPRPTLVVMAIAMGMAFDVSMQLGPARLVPLWAYSRIAPHLNIFAGTTGQIPLYEPLAMALMITWCACLIGFRDAEGNTFIERRTRTLTAAPARRAILNAIGYILVLHLLYLYVVAPFFMLWQGHMLTVTGSVQPFATIPQQPAGPQHHGTLGTALVVVWLLVAMLATYWFARKSATRPLPSGQSAPRSHSLQPADR